ncbi:MAG: hypothetical protein ACD_9C00048G0003, partial [uncultured bacterium]
FLQVSFAEKEMWKKSVLDHMKKKIINFLFAVVAIFVATVFLVARKVEAPQNNLQSTTNNSQQEINNNQQEKQIPQSQTVDPLENAKLRITKKPFGIFITKQNSPVSPERFAGYHTAVDLETTPDEQNIDVLVRALCDGKLLLVRNASGYGGVAVQSCALDGQDVTIVYGHIKLASMNAKVGDTLKAGDSLANLGKGYSSETDGERKHLHLGIHKGQSVNILGYVQNKNQLSDWLDPEKYLQ